MLPVVGVPPTGQRQMRPYRELFRRNEGFEYVSRYVTGLLVSRIRHPKEFMPRKCGKGTNPAIGLCLKPYLKRGGM